MKLVLWLGGPKVVESTEFAGEFCCPSMTDKEAQILTDVSQEISPDFVEVIPLEVDE